MMIEILYKKDLSTLKGKMESWLHDKKRIKWKITRTIRSAQVISIQLERDDKI